jgi:K+-transporting ATPase KdpF subunit
MAPSLYKFFSCSPICFYPSQASTWRVKNGHRIHRSNCALLRNDLRLCVRLRQAGEPSMTLFYMIGAIVAGGLMIYLVVALLKAEEL